MTFENVSEVVEAWGAEQANERLAEGWTLLAVVQGTVPEGNSHVKYVLGKLKGGDSGLWGKAHPK